MSGWPNYRAGWAGQRVSRADTGWRREFQETLPDLQEEDIGGDGVRCDMTMLLLDKELEEFYDHLLAILRKPIVKNGEWQSLACQPAWDGNGSWDSFVAHSWRGSGGARMLIAVNYAPHPSQCYLNLPFPEIKNRSVTLKDSLSSACYIREGNELLERGLYLDLQPWSYHVFDVEVSQ